MRLLRFATLSLFLGTVACAKVEIVHDLDEREANEIVVALNTPPASIPFSKVIDPSAGGNKGLRFMILVSASDADAAWKLLNEKNLPRKKDQGLGDVFQSGGLVPTASEEKAKLLLAVQGELTRTLKSIDGILDARVHVVMPEDSVLRVKEEDKAIATASVWYKYAPLANSAVRPLSDQEVAQLVANAVEKLKPENVKVVATPALNLIAPAAAAGGNLKSVFGVTIAERDVTKLRFIVAGFIAFIVLMTLAFLVVFLKKGAPPKRPGGLSRGGMEPPSA